MASERGRERIGNRMADKWCTRQAAYNVFMWSHDAPVATQRTINRPLKMQRSLCGRRRRPRHRRRWPQRILLAHRLTSVPWPITFTSIACIKISAKWRKIEHNTIWEIHMRRQRFYFGNWSRRPRILIRLQKCWDNEILQLQNKISRCSGSRNYLS